MVFVRARGSFVDGFEWDVAPFSWTTFTAHRSFLVRAVLGKWVKPILNIAEFGGVVAWKTYLDLARFPFEWLQKS